MLVKLVSAADEKINTLADVQNLMFALETASEISCAAILQSWEENDKVKRIAEGKLEDKGILERVSQATEERFGRDVDVVEQFEKLAKEKDEDWEN